MADEKILTDQPFLPFPHSLARSKKEALEELGRPCGRFCSPLSLEERFRLFLSRELDRTDPLGNISAIVASGVPLNWQVLLHYLHRENIIIDPHFIFSRRSNDLPKTYGVELRGRQEKSATDGRPVNGRTHGSSSSPEIAMAKAVGEVLERLFLTLYRRKSFVRSSYDALSRRRTPVVDIFDLCAFLPWQQQRNPRFARDAQAPLHWVKGETVEGAPVYIPAQLIFWNYDFRHDKEEPILQHPTTNGAGGHFTREEAILSGLLETIERDGFLINWLNRLSPRVIDVSSVRDGEFRIFLASIERYGLDIHFLNTTSDVGIPSVTCVLTDARGEEPASIVGAASGFSIEETMLKSGYEALNILQAETRRKDFSLPEQYEPFTDPGIGQYQRIALWKGKKMSKELSFFLKGKRQSIEDFFSGTPTDLPVAQRLEYVLGKLRTLGKGYEVYLYEVKHPVLKTLGYHVVQTLVPRLLPMYLQEDFATLDSKRLQEVPGKLGYTAAKELNPWPHPFP